MDCRPTLCACSGSKSLNGGRREDKFYLTSGSVRDRLYPLIFTPFRGGLGGGDKGGSVSNDRLLLEEKKWRSSIMNKKSTYKRRLLANEGCSINLKYSSTVFEKQQSFSIFNILPSLQSNV